MDQPNLTDTTRLQQLYSGRVARRGDRGGASCVTPETILAVVRKQGSEAQRLATLEHVMSCAACHREYQLLSAVDEAALEAEGATGGSRRQWWSRAGPLALAASLAVAVGTALLVGRRGPELERGGASEIELIAPVGGATAAGALTFVWRPLPGASRYVLEVWRSDRSVAFSDTTADTTLTISEPARLLPEPEYRWWVREMSAGAESRSSVFRSLRLSGR
jgi:hypothetical protein